MENESLLIDAIGNEFNEEIQQNLNPRIEEFIVRIHESFQCQLFNELFEIEMEYQRRNGEDIDFDDYLERFPEYETTISKASDSQQKTVSMSVRTDRNSIENAIAKLTRYRVTKKLGEGGMGTVYKAYDTRLERDVAIKFPHILDIAHGDEIIERFFREAKAASGLDHPNICAVYDRGEVEGIHYIVMKYIDGKTLEVWAKANQPLHAKKIANIFLQLTDALQVVHENNQIHRDIKPGNILVSDTDRPILTDFGLVREGPFRQAVSLVGTLRYNECDL
ncbi:serine/threonine-protein kinase [uncultured Rubinisphaera sp.]|uniref:serine/threonine protein kinase n=1 Tax=uncultured Rubinisphaera sp. TaxID=1678686 RepID=UPI0030DAEA60|tara:strand:+ start:404 stop:1237 length:834 start_codon:yes stop_codon:yes gene_type:complete